MKQNIFSLKMNLKKLQAFNSICFLGKTHFEEDSTQKF